MPLAVRNGRKGSQSASLLTHNHQATHGSAPSSELRVVADARAVVPVSDVRRVDEPRRRRVGRLGVVPPDDPPVTDRRDLRGDPVSGLGAPE
jgi:hypothetical protein